MPNEQHFESNAETLNKVFERAHSTPFTIPRFQRGYSWNKDEGNFDDFWEDLKSNDMRYFGTMLFNITPNRDGTIDIVDGQQRLTTCTIFASIVRNLINNYIKDLPSDDPFKRPLRNYASEIEQKYIKRKRTNIDTGEQEEIYYLNQRKPKIRQFFKKYIQDYDNQHQILNQTHKKDTEEGKMRQCYKELKNLSRTMLILIRH